MKMWLGTFLLVSLTLAAVPPRGDAATGSAEPVYDEAVTSKALRTDSSTNARPATLFPTPVLLVTPGTLDFGRVVTNTTATNTFLVENAGRGRVVGKVTVQPPFKIVEGQNYSLSRDEKQVVTIVYAPKVYTGSNDAQTVTFTGAGIAKGKVLGTPSMARPGTNPRSP